MTTAAPTGSRYYLNGFDWVMGVIDSIMRRATGAGNASQVVFFLDTPLEEELFTGALQRFLDLFPVLGGTVSRNPINLAPFWKMPKQGEPVSVPLTVTRLGDEAGTEAVHRELTRFINTPFAGPREHLAFHLVYGGGHLCVAMTFDHRIFDARGAESFMNLFQEFLSAGEDKAIADGVRLTQDADLKEWKQKFLSGQVVNQRVVALSRQTVQALPVDMEQAPQGFRYRILCFDREETEAIYDRAFSEAGYLMIMPYLFARVVEALHGVFRRRGVEGDSYVVPVSTDIRQAQDIRQQLFFNHNSMFFFQVPVEEAEDRVRLIQGVKEQMYQQVQNRFPQHLMAASSLIRIAPLSLMHRIFHLPMQGKIASFCFSHVSKCSYSSHDLMGARITNVYHMPRMPVPPGIGVFFNTFDGRLNATISWLEGTFTEEDVAAIENSLRSYL